jgi:hypothetical protein
MQFSTKTDSTFAQIWNFSKKFFIPLYITIYGPRASGIKHYGDSVESWRFKNDYA